MPSTRAIRFILLVLLVLLVLFPMSLTMYATGSSSPPATAEEATVSPPAEEVEPLFIPEPKAMSECMCVGDYATDIHRGTGSNCTEAKANLDSQLVAVAGNHCSSLGTRGACNFEVLVTEACCFNSTGGYYVVDGWAMYGCFEGWFICQQ